jgi:hypothetical protein
MKLFKNKRAKTRSSILPSKLETELLINESDQLEQLPEEIDDKLGFGFHQLKSSLKPNKPSPDSPLPPLDRKVEEWLDKLIAERRLQSNFISSTVKLVNAESQAQRSVPQTVQNHNSADRSQLAGRVKPLPVIKEENPTSIAESKKSTRVIKTAESAKARDEEALKKSKTITWGRSNRSKPITVSNHKSAKKKKK